MTATEFDAKSLSFLDWFVKWPGATFHPDIEIQDLRSRNAGRGITAKRDIPEDTVLFTIPRDAIINVLTSDLPRKIPAVFAGSTAGLEDTDNEADEEGEAHGPPDSWLSLILVMMYEYLQGSGSKWKPYFDVLPTSFDTLMFWSEDELSELQASSIIHRIGKDEADNTFRAKVLPIFEEHADLIYPEGSIRLSEDELITLAHRMGSTIMAYAFDLENDEEQADEENDDDWTVDTEGKLMMGMVPMADILNADAEPNAHVNHGDHNLTVTAIRPIRAGDEVLNYYGPLSNGELLRRYGYVTPKHARYDVVEVPWSLVLPVIKEQLQLDDKTWGKAINHLDDEEIEETFVVERDLPEPDSNGRFQGDMRLRDLPPDLGEQIVTLLKAIRHVEPEAIPDKRKRNEITVAVMHRAFELRLAEYSTPIEFDQRLIQEDSLLGRQKMAAVVRFGEKTLLHEALRVAQARLSGPSGSGDSLEPVAKRQKS